MNSGEITQEYDQHLGPVNSITFVDENRRFVTTSDDKTIRAWDYDIPVVIKYIAEPHMHSMPAVTLHPSSMCRIPLSNSIYPLVHLLQKNISPHSLSTIKYLSTAPTISVRIARSASPDILWLVTPVKWAFLQTASGLAVAMQKGTSFSGTGRPVGSSQNCMRILKS